VTAHDSRTTRVRLEAVVHGWVQGVGFRVFVARRAAALDLGGWVRNEARGTVQVVAEGDEPSLRTLLADLHEGPAGARVERVDERWGPAGGTPDRFEIRSGWHGGD
jgi:acylphosphatase